MPNTVKVILVVITVLIFINLLFVLFAAVRKHRIRKRYNEKE